MKSLSLKLTLAFLLVSLIVAGLAAVFIWQATEREFETLVVDRIREDFIEKVTAYYQVHGSWQGIAQEFPLRQPQNQPPASNQPKPIPIVFALANQNGIIVIPAGEYRPRDHVEESILAEGTPVEVDGVFVGTVLLFGNVPELDATEQRYLERTNQALLWATGAATIIALLLGALLARSMTRPIRELTSATRAVARGELEQEIPIRSQDELGELVSSFNQMSADLARATQSRQQMTADIAHDLGSPLTVIGGYLEAMQEGVLDATPERIGVMNTQITHLQHLVRDLRTLSLADAGQMSLNWNQVETRSLLQRVISTYELAAKQKGIHLSMDAGENLPSISIDEERMAQALGNLLGNALRYTPPEGEITLKAKTRGKDLVIVVEDTGTGIDAKDLSRIFERFYRADQTRNLDAGESGLGLAITRSIVEAHGGEISVSSESGRGTRFEIKLMI